MNLLFSSSKSFIDWRTNLILTYLILCMLIRIIQRREVEFQNTEQPNLKLGELAV